MEDKKIIEPLFERAEDYAKVSLELFKLKATEKTANVTSTLVSRGLVVLFLAIFTVVFNIGVALWLGDILGKAYYGFFCVAGFYAFVGAVLYFFMHKWIKRTVSNSIISQILS